MANIPGIYFKNAPLHLAEVLNSPFEQISTDWYGQPLSFEFSYFLAADSERLYFICRSDGERALHPESNFDTFTPGLWEYSVCELFIGTQQSPVYLEFNVAPNGAWWAAEFLSYRQSSETSLPQCQPFSARQAGAWVSGLVIPYRKFELDLSKCCLNVCAIIGHDSQVFIARHARATQEPDYHIEELRLPVHLLELESQPTS